jgi:hypothetical protein
MKRTDYRVVGGAFALGLGWLVSTGIGGQPLVPPMCSIEPAPVNPLEVAMFSMLPPEQQAQLAAGYVHMQAQAFERFDEPFAATDERYEKVAHVMSRDRFEQLSDAHRRVLVRMAEREEYGEVPMAACFAPGTDPQLVWEFSEMLYNTSSRFQQTTRWNNTATDGPGVGGQGRPITLTYSFVPDGTNLSGSGSSSSLFSWLNGIYGSPANWQPLFDQVFDRWEELTGVTYVYEANDDGVPFSTSANPGVLGVRGDVRIGAVPIDGNFNILAFNDFPNDGDMVFDAGDNFFNFTGNNSIRLRNVAAHEHGHGLGMLHVCPQNNTKLMEPSASTGFDGPQTDDILNGQRHYGDPLEVNGDFNELGEPGFPGILLSNLSIDDNSDIDFFQVDLSVPATLFVNVSPTGGSYLSGTQTQACNNGSTFNADSIHDLSLVVLEDNFITEVAASDNAPAGGTEFISVDILTPGTYFIRVMGDATNNIQGYQLTVSSIDLPMQGCNEADLAEPFGTLDFSDVVAFLGAFGAMGADADLAPPFGTWDFSDVVTFLGAFGAGCP